MAINDLAIMDAGADGQSAPWKEPPAPWKKLSGDLNDGAGGNYIYLAIKEDGVEAPITALFSAVSDNKRDAAGGPVAPAGYEFAPIVEGSVDNGGDLNGGAGGKYVYLCFSRLPDLGKPLQEIKVVAGPGEAPEDVGGGWEILRQDLNEGAGGDWIYVIYRR